MGGTVQGSAPGKGKDFPLSRRFRPTPRPTQPLIQ